MKLSLHHVHTARNAERCGFIGVQGRSSGCLNLNDLAGEPSLARTELESESAITSVVCAIVLVSLTLGGVVGFGLARALR